MEAVESEEPYPAHISEDDRRPKWNSKVQYLLSCIGFAVGFGNIWRFPYLCQTYGGGAFLIPYILALVLQGIPVFLIELAIGQRLRKGSIGVWNVISPYLGGVGYCSLVTSFLVSLYYNMLLALVIWYLANSFRVPLPWSVCPLNDSRTGPVEECDKSTASNYFWYRGTLNISPDIAESGSLQGFLVLCLAISWTIVYLCVIRGIETTGKVVYITATFPYLVLTIFLIYGLSLKGAVQGLSYLITPELNHLKNPRVWLDAATQIFFSLSLGIGGHIAYASYNPLKNDCELDSIIIALVNSATSLYTTIPVFCIVGFKATINYENCLERNIEAVISAFNLQQLSITKDNYTISVEALKATYPDKLANLRLKTCVLKEFLDQSVSGHGLAFIVFTEVVTHMPGSQVWAILFFVMLFTLGLSSMFGLIEAILTPILDFKVVSNSVRKEIISGVICLCCFLLALIFALRSGNYWLEVFDTYAAALPMLLTTFFEVIGVVYVYGIKRFSADVEMMTGNQPNIYWQMTWRFISPLLMLTIFVAFIMVQGPPSYNAWNPNYEDFPQKEKKDYPTWVYAICVTLASTACLFIPTVALFQLVRSILKKKQAEAQLTSMKSSSQT
ncbi:sodium-dependent neutral amino acid transporter B(0)AT3-like isoform X1 [Hemicordylus capensis]|uniref:sodium-dependent neutral amino acid transporter B(0)AT3-like isoform X1 n=1 Tax=Hemicordylus capensis TaxID=884348 RepID=UPI0023045364|nr:sodium-dependent neutral amino acid transporter B(0)AT3-like isoform X1 [Hemicordylus capensis]XP_053105539.1 sodium-dependent neutral amino acid transporter B(0)AT3-like isoform X1 [Hemicordylus capensis]